MDAEEFNENLKSQAGVDLQDAIEDSLRHLKNYDYYTLAVSECAPPDEAVWLVVGSGGHARHSNARAAFERAQDYAWADRGSFKLYYAPHDTGVSEMGGVSFFGEETDHEYLGGAVAESEVFEGDEPPAEFAEVLDNVPDTGCTKFDDE